VTAGGYGEVDHDLLADYLGGALAGTPDEAVVARLIERDPAWARAHDELASALARVADDLAAWAEPAPTMPSAVADRISAALAVAGPAVVASGPAVLAEASGAATDPDEVSDGPGLTNRPDALRVDTDPAKATVRRGIGVPAQPGPRRAPGGSRPAPARGTGTGPGRRRRWGRVAGPMAVAAASVVAVGLGMNQFVRGGAQDDSGGGHESAGTAASAAGPYRTTSVPQHSGMDWTPEALAAGQPTSTVGPFRSLAAPEVGPQVVASEGGERLPAPDGLDRLAGEDALDACLGAVSTEHGAGLISVDLVDYARFQGVPALIIRFSDPSGARWAWVSGPECGVPGSGADTRYRTRVG
jgi:hypothetical protein